MGFFDVSVDLKELEALRDRMKTLPKEVVDTALEEELINIKATTTANGAMPYRDSEKMETVVEGNAAIGEIRDTTAKAYFNEFGTGIVGSNNPAVADAMTEMGWQYDVNEHGEGGWIYPKEDGTFGRTSGLPALKAYQDAADDIRNNLNQIIENKLK